MRDKGLRVCEVRTSVVSAMGEKGREDRVICATQIPKCLNVF